jgi:hypothetical protein
MSSSSVINFILHIFNSNVESIKYVVGCIVSLVKTDDATNHLLMNLIQMTYQMILLPTNNISNGFIMYFITYDVIYHNIILCTCQFLIIYNIL